MKVRARVDQSDVGIQIDGFGQILQRALMKLAEHHIPIDLHDVFELMLEVLQKQNGLVVRMGVVVDIELLAKDGVVYSDIIIVIVLLNHYKIFHV
jgi:hypothetical protein